MARMIAALLGALLLSACEPRPLPPLVEFERTSADAVAKGKRIAAVLGCSGCHAKDLQGRNWSDNMGRLWTANLTRTAQQMDDEQLRRLLVSGSRSDRPMWGMPSHLFTKLGGNDMSALLAYLRSVPAGGDVHPPPTFAPEARRLVAAGVWKSSAQEVALQGAAMPPAAGPDHLLGRYLARSTCAECHGMNLSGGKPDPMSTPRPDLRMVAGYSLSDFATLLRTGKAVGDREVGLMSEVARGRYRHFTDTEGRALHAYLQAVAAQDK